MKILAVRTIPLQQDTFQAWKDTGVVRFLRRNRHTVDGLQDAVRRGRYTDVLHLGSTGLSGHVDIREWNVGETVGAVMTPGALRRTMNDALPGDWTPHWHKNPGFQGRGKLFCEGCELGPDDITDGYGDIQGHVEGTEYRVNTVGDRIVQAHRKTGNVYEGFNWDWVGLDGIRTLGIIPLLKSNVEKIPHALSSVLGWDIIVGDKPYVIEVNTCAGVNTPTALRIVEMMRTLSLENG